MGNELSKYDATASYLGYMYQVKYALYASLIKIKEVLDEEFFISIEDLDDVTFHREFEPVEILQTKHHLNSETNLTDRSSDVWKTIRIWCEGIKSKSIPINSSFFLITTSKVPVDTFIKYLKPDQNLRNITEVLNKFNEISSERSNKTNLSGYEAFNSLSNIEKEKFLNNVFIIDSAPHISNLNKLLTQEISLTVNIDNWVPFLRRLEGWWITRVYEYLSSDEKRNISSFEIHKKISSLRDQFKKTNLPIDDEEIERKLKWLTDGSGHDDKLFVKQLKMIEVSNQRVFYAIKNYYRASYQRSMWLNDGVILPGELGKYEKKLIEEWDYVFQQKADEMGKNASEEEKQKTARAIYSWVETECSEFIRPECTEPYVMRGTYQKLADDLKVGWHPEFEKRLMHLLLER